MPMGAGYEASMDAPIWAALDNWRERQILNRPNPHSASCYRRNAIHYEEDTKLPGEMCVPNYRHKPKVALAQRRNRPLPHPRDSRGFGRLVPSINIAMTKAAILE